MVDTRKVVQAHGDVAYSEKKIRFVARSLQPSENSITENVDSE